MYATHTQSHTHMCLRVRNERRECDIACLEPDGFVHEIRFLFVVVIVGVETVIFLLSSIYTCRYMGRRAC